MLSISTQQEVVQPLHVHTLISFHTAGRHVSNLFIFWHLICYMNYTITLIDTVILIKLILQND
jgi:hypothetical protein